ncbi:hypothetical protein [Saccharothrix sp. ST-888]|uniref:hypothetical protein n=1 Tax=Saccharothrix sp. ST-888 TaxID=1427391 RepID=UPI0005EC8046|nr:hypothetical protein [Saccharothrix sp. ST-888]KJK58416.1 hypothetical protein UK12_10300 [Saccharothrix sp. ST-888]
MGRTRGALPEETPQRRLTSIAGGRTEGGPVEERSDSARELGRKSGDGECPEAEQARLWHVVLSVAGQVTPLAELRVALERLAHDHSFFLTARYAADHAEIRYWEQARDLHDAAAIALRLWGEHKASANLPPWEIVGLEVVDRPTYHKRVAEGFGDPPPQLGGVHPY